MHLFPRVKKSQSTASMRNWNEMDYNILTKTFTALSIVDLATVSLVSKPWHEASTDPALWKKIDLSKLSFRSLPIPNVPCAWSDDRSSRMLSQFIKYAASLANGNTTFLIYNFFADMRNDHLITLAQGIRNLKRLVLPGWCDHYKAEVYCLMCIWRGSLESMTIPFNVRPFHILAAIGKFCKNFSELKMSCNFDVKHAKSLIKYTPNLRVLSIRCILVRKTALVRVLNGLQRLEVLNISHSLIVDRPGGGRSRLVIYTLQELSSICDFSRLKTFIYCEEGTSCNRCKHSPDEYLTAIPTDEDYGDLEVLWREDEISSLAH